MQSVESQLLASSGPSTVDSVHYQLLQWPDDHLGTIFSAIRKCLSNSK